MSLADLLPGKFGPDSRLPARIEDLRGPVRGIVRLPRNLSFPGMRECDLTDDPSRRSMYGLVLAQGSRHDIARLLNAGLLRQDWPLISAAIDARLRRRCERLFGLAEAGLPGTPEAAGTPEQPRDAVDQA